MKSTYLYLRLNSFDLNQTSKTSTKFNRNIINDDKYIIRTTLTICTKTTIRGNEINLNSPRSSTGPT